MPHMPNAPLIYTVAVGRFPRVPGIGKYADALLDAVRDSYPQFDEFILSFVRANINLDADATSSEIDRGKSKMLQFAAPDRKWALLITEEIFALHTSAYFDNEDFVARFKAGLRSFLSVAELRIDWMEAIGFRHLNLVQPRPGEALDDYLQTWVLPPKPDIEEEEISLLQGVYVGAYRTRFGELRFQLLRNPPLAFPADLNNPAVQKNDWVRPTPDGEFAIMDIDHGRHINPLEHIDVEEIGDTLRSLRSISSKLFDQTGTGYARRVWRGEV